MTKKKGAVTRVFDGDTFLAKSRMRTVRLTNVNAPEKGMLGGTKATKELRNLIKGKPVEVVPVARDPYGRTVT